MNDYPIAANAETIRLITFSASNRGGGLDEVALARCSNPNGPITDSCQSYCSSRCTGRAPLCITAGYNLLTGGIHHACVRARGVDTFPAPIFEPRSSLKDIRNLLSRWFIVFIGQFLQSCRWHCNSRAEEQLNKFFSGNYYYYLLFFFFPFYLRPGGKIKLLQHGVHGVGQETTGVSRWLWRNVWWGGNRDGHGQRVWAG